MSRYFAFVGAADRARVKMVKTISAYLSKKGNSVAIIKRVKDMEPFKEIITQRDRDYDDLSGNLVAFISPEGSKAVLLGEDQEPRIFQLAEDTADYILLDGFENLLDTPKVVILDANEPEEHMGVDTIALIGTHAKTRAHSLYKTESELPALVENLALPPNRNLNCGKCGFPNCKAFRAMVLKGEATVSACVAHKSPVRLCVNDKDIALVPFIQRLIESVITGMVRSLQIPDEEIKTIRIAIEQPNAT